LPGPGPTKLANSTPGWPTELLPQTVAVSPFWRLLMFRSTKAVFGGRAVRSSWTKLFFSISRFPPEFGLATPRPVSLAPTPLNLAHRSLLGLMGGIVQVVVPTTRVVGDVLLPRS
jgi:hypothetical protein